MNRRQSVKIKVSDPFDDKSLWDDAKNCAASKLSKINKTKKSTCKGILKKFICGWRSITETEIKEDMILRYINIAECSPLMVSVPGSYYGRRKIAVSEREDRDRDMVYHTIKFYRLCRIIHFHDFGA